MKTRILKKSETVNINVDHAELTCLWLALDTYANYLNRHGDGLSSAWCLDLSRLLFNTALELGDVEQATNELNYINHDQETLCSIVQAIQAEGGK